MSADLIRRTTSAQHKEQCCDDRLGGTNEERHWARQFVFGDSHADTHHFTESALKRAPKEIACAAAASALVSPLVSVADRCLVRRTGFAQAAGEATRSMVSNPRAFFGGLGFRLTFAVYFGTYAVANLSELALDAKKCEDDETRKSCKVAAAGLANVGLLAWRDSVFARAYTNSAQGVAMGPKVPLRSMKLFAARDVATMYAAFYLAPRAADQLVEKYGWDQNAAELSMAMSIPVAMQATTAPLHIHAMDFYARMHVKTFQERFDVILRDWRTVAFARGFRILPAFGLGSFANNKFREAFIMHEEEDVATVAMPVPMVPATLQRRITRVTISSKEASVIVSGSTPMLATSPDEAK